MWGGETPRCSRTIGFTAGPGSSSSWAPIALTHLCRRPDDPAGQFRFLPIARGGSGFFATGPKRSRKSRFIWQGNISVSKFGQAPLSPLWKTCTRRGDSRTVGAPGENPVWSKIPPRFNPGAGGGRWAPRYFSGDRAQGTVQPRIVWPLWVKSPQRAPQGLWPHWGSGCESWKITAGATRGARGFYFGPASTFDQRGGGGKGALFSGFGGSIVPVGCGGGAGGGTELAGPRACGRKGRTQLFPPPTHGAALWFGWGGSGVRGPIRRVVGALRW